MNRRQCMKTAAALGFASMVSPLGARLARGSQKPNLLIIHTDEHSFRTLGCYRKLMSPEQGDVWGLGNHVETPHIDSLAVQGAICNNYYASSPVCTPSRASLITGSHLQRGQNHTVPVY